MKPLALDGTKRAREPLERKTYNIDEVGEILGISRNAVYYLARENRLPVPVIRIGKRMMVSKEKLDHQLEWEAQEAKETKRQVEREYFEGLGLSFSKLRFKPDDVVLVKTPLELTATQVNEIRDRLKEHLHIDNEIVILSWGLDVTKAVKSAVTSEFIRVQKQFREALKRLHKNGADA